MPPAGDVKDERVTALVPAGTKEEWKQYTPPHSNRYESLSNLVRTAVHREVKGFHDTEADERGIDDETIEEFEARFDDFEEILGTFGNSLENLEVDVVSESPTHPNLDLEKLIYELLPENPADNEGITSGELSQRYGFEPDAVIGALDRLVARTSTVVRTEHPPRHDGEQLYVTYYRRGDN